MTRLPQYKYKALVKKLKKAGFEFYDAGKGSHEVWYNSKNNKYVTISCHAKPMAKGTLRAVIRHMGLTVKDFLDL